MKRISNRLRAGVSALVLLIVCLSPAVMAGTDETVKAVTAVSAVDDEEISEQTRTAFVQNVKSVAQTPAAASGEDYIGKHIRVRYGTMTAEALYGAKLKGKTYKLAMFNTGDSYLKMVDDFETEYRCTVIQDQVGMANYTSTCASKKAAGDPYDFVYINSSWYPAQIIANVMLPLDDYITTADLWDPQKEEGLCGSAMEALCWRNRIYCAAGNYEMSPYVIWYNKKMWKQAKLEDPLTLYKEGKWTWEKVYDQLSVLTDTSKGIYGLNALAPYYAGQFITTYDTDFAFMDMNGVFKNNLTDKKLYNACAMLQKMSYDSGAVCNPKDNTENGVNNFLNGTTAACIGSAAYWSNLEKQVNNKAAFDNSADNIGVVPAPTQSTSQVHAVWNWNGYGSGNGTSDPFAGVLFAKWNAKYDVSNCYVDSTPAAYKDVFKEVLNSDNLIGPKDGFQSSSGSLQGLAGQIAGQIAKGAPVAATLKAYEKQTDKYIDAACKKEDEVTTPVRYTVTFKDWDGLALKTAVVEQGQSVVPPADPTREGYEFIGWDMDCTAIQANTVIWAQYKPIFVIGDVTGDGKVDSKDVVRLRKYLAAYDYETGTSTVVLGPDNSH